MKTLPRTPLHTGNVQYVLKSKHTGEFFRMIWRDEVRWTEHAILAHHYENELAAQLDALAMAIEEHVTAEAVDLSVAA
jgi:hypothetical protein